MRNDRPITFFRALAVTVCGLFVADLVLNGSRSWPLAACLCIIVLSELADKICQLLFQEGKLRSGLQKVDMMETELKDLRGQFKLLKMGYEQGNRK